jgi:pimeloyl-ACP methyl ester carboxylesterase
LIAHSIGATAAVRALWDGLDAGAVVLVGPSADLTTPALRFSETFGFSRDIRERMHRVIEERVGRSWSIFDAIELAPALMAPVLVVHDRGDAEVPWQHGAALARAWRGSEMLMTEGLGHRRILRDPDVVAAAVAFVAARTAERGIAATVEADPQATPLEILMAG